MTFTRTPLRWQTSPPALTLPASPPANANPPDLSKAEPPSLLKGIAQWGGRVDFPTLNPEPSNAVTLNIYAKG